jgi:hypothetical protein
LCRFGEPGRKVPMLGVMLLGLHGSHFLVGRGV